VATLFAQPSRRAGGCETRQSNGITGDELGDELGGIIIQCKLYDIDDHNIYLKI